MDLRKIEKPFGLLDAETQAALQAHKGGIEVFSGDNWYHTSDPLWFLNLAYRAAPTFGGQSHE
jgi:hypothetical protein